MIRSRRARRMTMIAEILLLFAATLAAAQGAKKVAVLELRNAAGLTPQEGEYLTDLVRDAASRALGGRGFLVITRETLYELLPPGTDLSKCDADRCVAETGRTIGADYIAAGEVLTFQGEYRFKLSAFHSETTAFLGSKTAAGGSLKEIEKEIDGASMALFGLVLRHAGGGTPAPAPPPVAEGKLGQAPADWSVPEAGATAILRLESDPAGAVVMMNGALLCQSTPCSKEVPIGPATISMQRERYLPREGALTVGKGNPPVSWKLEPNFGWLTVKSEPSGLAVRINGKDAGPTPVQGTELDPGAYDVVVTDPRYFDQGERFTLARGQRKEVNVTMPPREGAVKVSAQDAAGNSVEAEVSADDRVIGTTPLLPTRILVGEHKVTVRASGLAWENRVTVREREVTEVQAVLQPAADVVREGDPNVRTIQFTIGGSKLTLLLPKSEAPADPYGRRAAYSPFGTVNLDDIPVNTIHEVFQKEFAEFALREDLVVRIDDARISAGAPTSAYYVTVQPWTCSAHVRVAGKFGRVLTEGGFDGKVSRSLNTDRNVSAAAALQRAVLSALKVADAIVKNQKKASPRRGGEREE